MAPAFGPGRRPRRLRLFGSAPAANAARIAALDPRGPVAPALAPAGSPVSDTRPPDRRTLPLYLSTVVRSTAVPIARPSGRPTSDRPSVR